VGQTNTDIRIEDADSSNKLDIKHDGTKGSIISNGALAMGGQSDFYFQTYDSGVDYTTKMILKNNGNVGIGTTSPGAKLDVDGTVRLPETGTATSNTNYPSREMRLQGSGWDSNGSHARSVSMYMRTDMESSIYPDAFLTFYEEDPSYNHWKLKLPGRGSGSSYQHPDAAYFNGNVGIGTTGPGARLDVQADATYSIYAGNKRIGNVAEPVLDTDVATRQYVDGLFEGGTEITGDLNMGGFDILGVNKLTVNTIDPLYRIDNVLYSSYAPSMVGGVKEEYVGKTKIDKYNSSIGQYEHIIDFDKVKPGSDLWLWRKVIDYSEDKVEVLLTPYGDFANLYYKLEGNKIIFRSDKRVEASYRLVANRFDWKKWPTLADDQEEKGGLFIE
jgi:hypothetical protein